MSDDKNIWRKPALYVCSGIALILGIIGGNYFNRQQVVNLRHDVAQSMTETSGIKAKYSKLIKKYKALAVAREEDSTRADDLVQTLETAINKLESDIRKQKLELEQCKDDYTSKGRDLAFVSREAQRIQDEYLALQKQLNLQAENTKCLEAELENTRDLLAIAEERSMSSKGYEKLRKESQNRIDRLEAESLEQDKYIEQLEMDYEDANISLTNAQSRVQKLSDYAHGLRSALEKTKNELACAQEDIGKRSKDYNELEKKSRAMVRQLEESMHEQSVSYKLLESRLKKSAAAVKSASNRVADLQSQVKELQKEQQQLGDFYRQSMDEKESEYSDCMTQKAGLEESMHEQSVSYKLLESRLKKSEAAVKAASNRVADLQSQVKELQKEQQQLGDFYRQSMDEKESEYSDCMTQKAGLEEQLQAIYEKSNASKGLVSINSVGIRQDSCLSRALKSMLEQTTNREWHVQRKYDNSSTKDGIYIWKKVNEISSNFPEQPEASLSRLKNLDLVYDGDMFNVYVGDLKE